MRSYMLSAVAVVVVVVVLVLLVCCDGVRSESPDPGCYRIPSASWCANLTNNSKCLMNKTEAYCCNIPSSEELRDNIRGLQEATTLHILNSNLARLDAAIFQQFRCLKSLSITDNTIVEVYGSFRFQDSILTCLNISNNAIREIDPGALQGLHGIQMLDLSYNNITKLPILPKSSFRLDISHNLKLECKDIVKFYKKLKDDGVKMQYKNYNHTVCVADPPSVYINKTIVWIPMAAVEDIKEIDENCPKFDNGESCYCSVLSLNYMEGNKYVYQASVDCSHKQLTSLPKSLPKNTIFLDISHNNITSLDGINNINYSTIVALNADYNKITSVKVLEGSSFLYNFNNFSLRYNNINLMWLIMNKAHIPDYDELWCSNLHNTRIIDLDDRSVCVTPTDLKGYMHYIIALEILLFFLLIAKVSYDYYVFKTAGYLPWPASKMPKLPCDWCFET